MWIQHTITTYMEYFSWDLKKRQKILQNKDITEQYGISYQKNNLGATLTGEFKESMNTKCGNSIPYTSLVCIVLLTRLGDVQQNDIMS